MSFLICLVDDEDDTIIIDGSEEVSPHELAVRNTVDRLIAQYHPGPFNSQGFSFPQNPGQPEDIFNMQVAESSFFFSTDQILQEMVLQGLSEESMGEVTTGLGETTNLAFVSQEFVGEIRSASGAEEYFAVLGRVCNIILSYHTWEITTPVELRQALMDAFRVSQYNSPKIFLTL